VFIGYSNILFFKFDMRLIKLPTLVLFLLVLTNSFGQTQDNTWLFSANTNIINLLGDDVEKAVNIGGPTLSLSRYLGAGVSIGGQYSLGQVNNFNDSFSYNSVDGILKVNISSGSFVPYVTGGYGFSRFADGTEREGFFPSTETSRTIFGGLGFNVFLSDKLAVNLQSTYRKMNENDGFDHLQHFAGLSYSFGSGSGDADKDGISDKKDKCPNVPGLKEYEGCPDTDGDTIIDKDDKCPEIPGLPEFDGCIDTDGDGIADPDDNCPEEVGPIEANGCPDSDGDGVIDSEDKCINEVGPQENNGCPWQDTDGDGINDNEDLCKDEPGTPENNGCPKLDGEIVKTLNDFGSRINFAANSYQIFGRKTLDILEKIKALLMENPDGNLVIEGYSSSDGDEAYNNQLSIKRAEAVRNHLIGLGIPAERLEIQGYGEGDPIGDNASPQGRAINRRVQFKTKRN